MPFLNRLAITGSSMDASGNPVFLNMSANFTRHAIERSISFWLLISVRGARELKSLLSLRKLFVRCLLYFRIDAGLENDRSNRTQEQVRGSMASH